MEILPKYLQFNKPKPMPLALILISIAILVTLGCFQYGAIFGISILIICFGVPIVYAVVAYPKFGVVTILIAAYLIMEVIRFGINFPLGTLMDTLQLLLIIGFLISQKRNPAWQKFNNPITAVILLWITYNLMQFFNLAAESRMSWLYTIRSVAVVMLMYFVFMTQIKSVQFIRLIIKIWLVLSIFAALYATKQELLGFFPFEQRALDQPGVRDLLFIAGHWRKFSIFSDPVSFSYNMVISALLCLVLLLRPMSYIKRGFLIFLIFFFLINMLYSGTRGAYVLFPAAAILLVILKFNRIVMFATIIFGGILFILIFIPTSNYTIYRFQTAFRPSEDASFNVRKKNQKRIQPFIQSHPFGGGLGATGTWGQRFAPDSYLANFPPDSGYVRVAVELGWVGIFLFCTLMFVILKTGIKNYYLIKDPELKNYCLAMVVIIFALNVGNYPQEALVQFPTSIYFYLFVALINITLILDKQKEQELTKIKL